MNIYVASLPQGDDPDSFVRREGGTALQAVIDAAKPWQEWRFARVEAEVPATAEECAAAVQVLLPVVRVLVDPVVRARYRKRLAALAGVSEGTIARMLGDRLEQTGRGGVAL